MGGSMIGVLGPVFNAITNLTCILTDAIAGMARDIADGVHGRLRIFFHTVREAVRLPGAIRDSICGVLGSPRRLIRETLCLVGSRVDGPLHTVSDISHFCSSEHLG